MYLVEISISKWNEQTESSPRHMWMYSWDPLSTSPHSTAHSSLLLPPSRTYLTEKYFPPKGKWPSSPRSLNLPSHDLPLPLDDARICCTRSWRPIAASMIWPSYYQVAAQFSPCSSPNPVRQASMHLVLSGKWQLEKPKPSLYLWAGNYRTVLYCRSRLFSSFTC
jgi:hypothetical protein